MYELPTEIIIEGVPYKIRNRGDYRIVLGAFSALEDPELEKKERIISALIIFYEDLNEVEDVLTLPNLESAVTKMYEFFNGDKPESVKTARKLLDWEDDSAMICAAVNNVAKTEIRTLEYLHWWTFLSYYMSVGESVMSTVVSIRDKMITGKKMEKWENEYKRANPQYFIWKHKTADEIDADEWVKSVWNKE